MTVEVDSILTFLATTMILTLSSFAYVSQQFRKRIESLELEKQDVDSDSVVQEDIYQGWLGTFADGQDSLVVNLIWKKECLARINKRWLEWDGLEDPSVVNRNFYIGNNLPSFTWTFNKRENDTRAVVKETFTDGWDSLVQLKIVAFIQEDKTNDEMNLFLKELLLAERIEWEKTLISKDESIEIFG